MKTTSQTDHLMSAEKAALINALVNNQHEVARNRQIVRDLWATLDRKPTLAEIEAAIAAA